jgi:hypothetical protein
MFVRVALACFSRPATTVRSPAPCFIYQRGRAVVSSCGPSWAQAPVVEAAEAVVEAAEAVVEAVVGLPQAVVEAVVGLPQLGPVVEAFRPSGPA